MIRPAVILWTAAAAAAVAVQFQVSYGVIALENRLERENRAILAEQNSIRVLRAEAAFLAQPARLAELAEELTELVPIRPDQLVTRVDGLPWPLPEPAAPPVFVTLAEVPGLDRLPVPLRKPQRGPPPADPDAPAPFRLPSPENTIPARYDMPAMPGSGLRQ